MDALHEEELLSSTRRMTLLFVIPADAFARLGEKTTVMSPEVLVAAGVPCCRYRFLLLGLVRKYVVTMRLWNSRMVQVYCFQVVIFTGYK